MTDEKPTVNMPSKVKFRKLECPFDLATIFTVTVDQENLKGLLEFILDNLGDCKNNHTELATQFITKYEQVNKNKTGVEKSNDDVELIKKMIKELEQKSIETDGAVSDIKTQVESMSMNVALNQRTTNDTFEDYKEMLDKHEKDLEKHTKEIEELKNRPVAGPPVEIPPMPEMKAGDNIDINQLMNIFASKQNPDNTIKRIYDLENGLKDTNSRLHNLDGLTDRLENLENCVAKLETRADGSDKRLDTDEADIEELKKRLTALEGMEMPTGAVSENLDTGAIIKQIQLIKNEFNTFKVEIIKKAPTVDLDKLRTELKDHTNKEVENLERSTNQRIKDATDSLSHKHEMLSAEFENFKQRDFRELEGRVTALEKKFAKLAEAFANFKVPDGGGMPIDDGAIRALAEKVGDIEDALNQLRNEFAKWMKELQDSLNQKADFAQMDKALQDRLADIVKALTKQFADKGDTRKALKIHEKQFQNLYNLIMSKGGTGENEEDAMFSKKPLGGLSCASCEKGLIDMYGRRVEFMPWNKLPFRDPAERIARVGQGFSKMLSMINPDQLSRYEQGSKMAQQQQQQPMHNSQHDPMGGQDQFYDPNNPMGGADINPNKTHSRFPNAGDPRFAASDGKRPGSVGGRERKGGRVPGQRQARSKV